MAAEDVTLISFASSSLQTNVQEILEQVELMFKDLVETDLGRENDALKAREAIMASSPSCCQACWRKQQRPTLSVAVRNP